MHIILASVLFLLAAFLPLALVGSGKLKKESNGYLMAFSGAYLFSITIVHLLPELFERTANHKITAICLLIGFFLQIIIELFLPSHDHHPKGNTTNHTPIALLIGLCLHGLLEGTALLHDHHGHDFSGHTHEGHSHDAHNSQVMLSLPLFLGVILHHIPAALALAAVLFVHFGNKLRTYVLFTYFALATPIGIWISYGLTSSALLSADYTNYFFALVAGNFLHIATSIFSGHGQKKKRLGAFMSLLLGVGLAILSEMLY